MNVTQQHMLDLHRAARHGVAPPPPPGRDDWPVLRAAREHRRFTSVLAGRPASPGALRLRLRLGWRARLRPTRR
ncbi:hypothetical protein QWM81_28940 [Streptomyces ficellus]|uniref:Uncharacterized protein n=1 Tax=Streptomyces ficellus TaxID=1977088 RepID=A0ABT7ZFD1_9ACTN|nr:hypothetical protein [Streptomyces ficellus]MDN3297987.1 hypothetical protein [Streptomyces ficellus]